MRPLVQHVQVYGNRIFFFLSLPLFCLLYFAVCISAFFQLLCVPLSFASTWQEWNGSQMCTPGGLCFLIAWVKFPPNILIFASTSQWKPEVSFTGLMFRWPPLWNRKCVHWIQALIQIFVPSKCWKFIRSFFSGCGSWWQTYLVASH